MLVNALRKWYLKTIHSLTIRIRRYTMRAWHDIMLIELAGCTGYRTNERLSLEEVRFLTLMIDSPSLVLMQIDEGHYDEEFYPLIKGLIVKIRQDVIQLLDEKGSNQWS